MSRSNFGIPLSFPCYAGLGTDGPLKTYPQSLKLLHRVTEGTLPTLPLQVHKHSAAHREALQFGDFHVRATVPLRVEKSICLSGNIVCLDPKYRYIASLILNEISRLTVSRGERIHTERSNAVGSAQRILQARRGRLCIVSLIKWHRPLRGSIL